MTEQLRTVNLLDGRKLHYTGEGTYKSPLASTSPNIYELADLVWNVGRDKIEDEGIVHMIINGYQLTVSVSDDPSSIDFFDVGFTGIVGRDEPYKKGEVDLALFYGEKIKFELEKLKENSLQVVAKP